MENTYSLINSVAALGADITLSNGSISISVDAGTFPKMEVKNIRSMTKTTGVAETAQVQNITFTAANSTLYEFAITQNVSAPNGAPAVFIASYTSDASATEQEIVDAFIAQVNAQTGSTGIQITATDGGASTVTLTAKTGYAKFTPVAITNTTVSAVTTAGVVAKGVGADLILAGISGAVSGSTYTSYVFQWYESVAAQMGNMTATGENTHTLYVDQGDVDFSAFDSLLNIYVNPSSKVVNHATAAINSTATATAAQVATGWITSTSAAGTTITLPTGTLLGAELGAVQGSVFDLYIDNTAGASTVTIAVATNGIKTDAANTTAGSFGQLTVASGATGLGRFTLMFSSATAYAFTRTA